MPLAVERAQMKEFLQKAKQSRWVRTLRLAHERWTHEDGDQRAAAFVYYLLLSLLPLIILLVAAGSWFVGREDATLAVVSLLKHYTPMTGDQEREAVKTIREWLQAGGKISLVALPLLLWGSIKFLRTLIRTSNRMWLSPTYNWWRLPLKSLGLLVITASVVVIGTLLPALARVVERWLVVHLDVPQWTFTLLLHLIPCVVMFYGLIMIYKLAPNRPTRLSEVWLGALSAAVFIWLGEWLFLIYATRFAHANVLYGALGGIMAFLVWIYLSSCVVVFGICFCAARAEIRGKISLEPEASVHGISRTRKNTP